MTVRRSVVWLSITTFLVCAWTVYLYAHGGGLDAYGCHNNRKAGGYHCHRGPLAGQSFGSREQMLKQLQTDKSGAKVDAKNKPRR